VKHGAVAPHPTQRHTQRLSPSKGSWAYIELHAAGRRPTPAAKPAQGMLSACRKSSSSVRARASCHRRRRSRWPDNLFLLGGRGREGEVMEVVGGGGHMSGPISGRSCGHSAAAQTPWRLEKGKLLA